MNLRTVQRAATALALAGAVAAAGAGTVSLGFTPGSPFAVGDTVTLTVADTRPRDMFDATAGFAAADFLLQYDSAALRFVALGYADWIGAAAGFFADGNGDVAGEVRVTMAGIEETELPATAAELFRVRFTVLEAPGGAVTLSSPFDPPTYAFQPPVPLTFEIGTVPLPPTLPLALVALAALAAVRSRRPAPAAVPRGC